MDPNLHGLMIDDLLRGRRPLEMGDLRPGIVTRSVMNASGLIAAATYGDSKARLATAGNNFSVLQPAALAGGGSSTTQVDRVGIAYFYPAIQWYGDGGIAGETLVQMIARETASSSSTRKSLDDLASTGAKLLFFSGGVNDVNALSAAADPATDSNVATIIQNRKDLLYRALSRFQMVVDVGLYGIDPTTPTADTAYRQRVLLYVEQQMSAFAASMGGRIRWLPLSAVVGNGSGGFKAGYADNTGVDTLGLHLNLRGTVRAFSWLAARLAEIFGACDASTIKYPGGPNMLQNPDFASTTSQAYGTLADGVTLNATGTAVRSNAQIAVIDGVRYQLCTFTTPDATSSTCQIKLTAPIFGGAPTFAVATNDVLGLEFDVLVDDGFGGAPTAALLDSDAAFNCQFQFQAGSGNRTYWFGTSAFEKAPDQAVHMRIHAPKMVVPVDSASLTGVDCYLRYICGGAGVVRLGVGNPRLVKLS